MSRKIKKMLEHWASHQLITQEQAQKIINYEKTKSSRPWVLYGFLILGAVVIGIGIISLIASNWDILPDDLKLFIDFLLLICLAAGTYCFWKKNKPIFFEVCLAFFMLLCLASIGLISQIYHTGGQLYEALFLWSIITSGIFIISRRLFVPAIWAIGFFPSIFFTALNSPLAESIFQEDFLSLFMTLPLFSGVLTLIFKNINEKEKQTKIFQVSTLIMGTIAIIAAEIVQSETISSEITPFFISYFFAICLGYAFFIDIQYKKIQKILFLFILILYLTPFHFLLLSIQSSILYAIFSIFISVTTAIFFASLKQRKLFHLFLIITGIRFLILYFQALGGLATTGINLIAAGILIISMVNLWHKYHNRVVLWTERLVK